MRLCVLTRTLAWVRMRLRMLIRLLGGLPLGEPSLPLPRPPPPVHPLCRTGARRGVPVAQSLAGVLREGILKAGLNSLEARGTCQCALAVLGCELCHRAHPKASYRLAPHRGASVPTEPAWVSLKPPPPHLPLPAPRSQKDTESIPTATSTSPSPRLHQHRPHSTSSTSKPPLHNKCNIIISTIS